MPSRWMGWEEMAQREPSFLFDSVAWRGGSGFEGLGLAT